MSLDTNYKILAGSIIKYTDRRILLGNSISSDPLVLYDLLLKNLEYATKLYTTLEDPDKKVLYKLKIKVLTHGIDILKHQCPYICNYRDSYILTKKNNPPTIDDHSFDLPLSVLTQAIPHFNLIHNFKDIDHDVLAKFVFTELPENIGLYVNNRQAIKDVEYSNKDSVSAKYGFEEGERFFIVNSYEQNPDGTSTCTAGIRTLNKEEVFNTEGTEGYKEIFDEGKFVGIKDGNAVFQRVFNKNQGEKSLVFQSLENITNEIPNDTIIYVHLDTTSMRSCDVIDLEHTVQIWWADFKEKNESFVGSLLINTLKNNVIEDGILRTKTVSTLLNGRVDCGYIKEKKDFKAKINQVKKGPGNIDLFPYLYNDFKQNSTDIERWLLNPMEAILRQKFKEIEASYTFPSLESLTEYIKGKSLVVLTFVDEASPSYHRDKAGVDIAVSDKYINDYNSFLYLRNYLRFFKGVLYPITRTETNEPFEFLIHSIAAIERKYDNNGNPISIFSNDEIDALLGSFKKENLVSKRGSFYNSFMHNRINENNPYERYNRLAELGWEGRWDKYSPVADVIGAADFSNELNDILTTIGEQEITTIKEIRIPFKEVESPIESVIKIKAQDSSSYDPLYSNEATVTVNHVAECITNIPEPYVEEVTRTINHKSVYTFRREDFSLFISELLLYKITGVEMAITGGDNQEVDQDQDLGHLQYHAHKFSSVENQEIVMKLSDLSSGRFSYVSNPDIQETVTITVKYKLSYIGGYNYSQKEGTIVITKNPNTLTAPTFILSENLQVVYQTIGAVEIPLTLSSYNGIHDNLRYYWEELQSPDGSQASIVSPYSKDLEVLNLKNVVGTYKYKVTVTVTDEPFEVVKEVTITVTNVVS